jgi:hypothetical protein
MRVELGCTDDGQKGLQPIHPFDHLTTSRRSVTRSTCHRIGNRPSTCNHTTGLSGVSVRVTYTQHNEQDLPYLPVVRRKEKE